MHGSECESSSAASALLMKPITYENGQRWARVVCHTLAGDTPRPQNRAQVVMSVLAHAACKEKINASL